MRDRELSGPVNPHLRPSVALSEIVRSIVRNRGLIAALIHRDIASRYRGSALGFAWAVLNPMIMVGVYTFVFGVAFKARWTGGTGETVEFALLLFLGLVIYNILSECLVRSPVLIISNPNYVKKISFPLEILPVSLVGSAVLTGIVNFCVWYTICTLLFRTPSVTTVFVPFAIIPLAILALGVGWLMASLGVFIRDLAQVVPFLSTMLLFLSPVFYPVAALPEFMRPIAYLNPLTLPIETIRNLTLLGGGVDFEAWLIYLMAAMTFGYLGFVWFQRTRKGFADVI